MSKPWALQTPEEKERHRQATARYNASHKEQRHAYYEANKEAIAAYWRAHYVAHGPRITLESRRRWWRTKPEKNTACVQRRRARIKGSPVIEKFTNLEIFERDRWFCGICGMHVLKSQATIDHIVPLSRGGEHSRANVQTAHHRCNCAKGARQEAA